ncbi:hypothetical protein EBU24_01420 [bacterium]|nr:hypothetical protein [bacterium]
MKNRWYVIKDLNEFIEYARSLVFKYFGETNQEQTDDLSMVICSLSNDDKLEMDRVISREECDIIAKQHIKTKINNKTKRVKHYITDTILQEMLESFNDRMVSNILNKLVNDGHLESAFDEKSNDFIFWVVDKNENKESPETD